MSLPTDSVAPAPPTGSSNPWSLVQWWKRICDWIAALSPSGADKYDTGWINIALTNGWAVDSGMTPQVRRVGRQVRIRGRVTGGAGAVTTLDAQFRPDAQHQSAIRDGSGNNVGIIIVAPNGEVTVGTATRPNIDTGWFTA